MLSRAGQSDTSHHSGEDTSKRDSVMGSLNLCTCSVKLIVVLGTLIEQEHLQLGVERGRACCVTLTQYPQFTSRSWSLEGKGGQVGETGHPK